MVPTATFLSPMPPSRGLFAGLKRDAHACDTTHVHFFGSTRVATHCRFASRLRTKGNVTVMGEEKKRERGGERAGVCVVTGGEASRADGARGRAYVRRKNEEDGRRAARPPAQGRRRSQLRAKRHADASLFRAATRTDLKTATTNRSCEMRLYLTRAPRPTRLARGGENGRTRLVNPISKRKRFKGFFKIFLKEASMPRQCTYVCECVRDIF